MYAIGNIIWGVPLSEEASDLIDAWEASEEESSPWFEDKETLCGFTTAYSGAGNSHVGWCGVQLDEIDETEDIDLGSSLPRWTPTPEQKAEVAAKVEKLHPELRALCQPIGLYIIWSTS